MKDNRDSESKRLVLFNCCVYWQAIESRSDKKRKELIEKALTYAETKSAADAIVCPLYSPMSSEQVSRTVPALKMLSYAQTATITRLASS